MVRRGPIGEDLWRIFTRVDGSLAVLRLCSIKACPKHSLPYPCLDLYLRHLGVPENTISGYRGRGAKLVQALSVLVGVVVIRGVEHRVRVPPITMAFASTNSRLYCWQPGALQTWLVELSRGNNVVIKSIVYFCKLLRG